MYWLRHALVFRVLLLGAVACGGEGDLTQVVVLLDAPASVRASTSRLEIEVVGEGGGAASRQVQREVVGPSSWPLQAPVAPQGGLQGRLFRLEATAFGTGGEVIAVGRLQTGFVFGASRSVRVWLDSTCALACSPSETCVSASCRTAAVPVGDLEPWPAPPFDGGTGLDGGSADGGADAGDGDGSIDAGLDGGATDGGFDAGPPGECPRPYREGDLVITELMIALNGQTDWRQEWFEIHNPRPCIARLSGVLVRSPDDGVTVEESLGQAAIAPGGYAVIAPSTDPALSPGLAVTLAYGAGEDGFQQLELNSLDDYLALRSSDGQEIDRVSWEVADVWAPSRARQFPPMTDAMTNDIWANACNSTSTYATWAGGDLQGTPGAVNAPCD